MLRVEYLRIALHRREFHFLARQQFPVPHQAFDLVGLEQARDTARQLANDAGAALLHLPDVNAEITGLDAVLLEFVLGPMVKLGRLEHRLGGNAACIETGTAEGILAVAVLPFVDAGDGHAVLCSTDRGDIAGRPGADNYNVKTSAHFLFASLYL